MSELALAPPLLAPAEEAVCARLLEEGSRSFSLASKLLPRRLRLPVAAVYAFCRVADDAIDESDRPDLALLALRRRLDRIYQGRPGTDLVDRAMAAVVRSSGLPRAPLDALLEGFAWDAEGRSYPDLSSVRAYGVRVAGAVGIVMTHLMAPSDPRFSRQAVLARAADLGVAMQLTNIARDVGEDARRGRLYLPAEWMAAEGLDPTAFLADPLMSPALGRVVERLLQEADRLYARADSGIAMLPWDCRVAIRAARLFYAEIGEVVRARGHDSVRHRAFTSLPTKIWLAVRSLGGLLPARLDHTLAEAPPLAEAAALVAATR